MVTYTPLAGRSHSPFEEAARLLVPLVRLASLTVLAAVLQDAREVRPASAASGGGEAKGGFGS
jgi:hypothetical protein